MTDELKHLSEAEYKQTAEKIGEAVMTTQKISDEAVALAAKIHAGPTNSWHDVHQIIQSALDDYAEKKLIAAGLKNPFSHWSHPPDTNVRLSPDIVATCKFIAVQYKDAASADGINFFTLCTALAAHFEKPQLPDTERYKFNNNCPSWDFLNKALQRSLADSEIDELIDDLLEGQKSAPHESIDYRGTVRYLMHTAARRYMEGATAAAPIIRHAILAQDALAAHFGKP